MFDQSTQLADEVASQPPPPASSKLRGQHAMVVHDSSSSDEEGGVGGGGAKPVISDSKDTSSSNPSRAPRSIPAVQIDLVLSSDDEEEGGQGGLAVVTAKPAAAAAAAAAPAPATDLKTQVLAQGSGWSSRRRQASEGPPPASTHQAGTGSNAAAPTPPSPPSQAPASALHQGGEGEKGASASQGTAESSSSERAESPPQVQEHRPPSPPPVERVLLPAGTWSTCIKHSAPSMPESAVSELVISAEESRQSLLQRQQEQGGRERPARGKRGAKQARAAKHMIADSDSEGDGTADKGQAIRIVTVLDDLVLPVHGGVPAATHAPSADLSQAAAEEEAVQWSELPIAVRPPGTIGSGQHALLVAPSSSQLRRCGSTAEADAVRAYYNVASRTAQPSSAATINRKVFRRAAHLLASGYFQPSGGVQGGCSLPPGATAERVLQYGVATTEGDVAENDEQRRQLAAELEQDALEDAASLDDLGRTAGRVRKVNMSVADVVSQAERRGVPQMPPPANGSSTGSKKRWRDDQSVPSAAAAASQMPLGAGASRGGVVSAPAKRSRRGVSSSQARATVLGSSSSVLRGVSVSQMSAQSSAETGFLAAGSDTGLQQSSSAQDSQAGAAAGHRRGVPSAAAASIAPSAGASRRRRGVSSSARK